MIEFVIKYWLEFLFTGITGFVIGYAKKIKEKQDKQDEKNKAIEEGLQALLRNELVRRYREYETKGELSILDKENIEAMFKQYEKLGGNGTVKHLMEELLNLPTKVIKN